jgi:hypothetical protein
MSFRCDASTANKEWTPHAMVFQGFGRMVARIDVALDGTEASGRIILFRR